MSDPYAGTNTRNLLQHIISPKIVGPTGGTYSVKTDLVNVDKIVASGSINAQGSIVNTTSSSSSPRPRIINSDGNFSTNILTVGDVSTGSTPSYLGTPRYGNIYAANDGTTTLADMLIAGSTIELRTTVSSQKTITYTGTTDSVAGHTFNYISSSVNAGSGTFTFYYANSGSKGLSFVWTKAGLATNSTLTENGATLDSSWDSGSGNFTVTPTVSGIPYKAVLTVTQIL